MITVRRVARSIGRFVIDFSTWLVTSYWWLFRHFVLQTKVSFVPQGRDVILFSTSIAQGRVGVRTGDRMFVSFKAVGIAGDPYVGALVYNYSDRGRTWCFGWEGQEVEAFEATIRLSR